MRIAATVLVICLSMLVGCTDQEISSQGTQMSATVESDLDQRIERLKADVAAGEIPADAEEVRNRSLTLYAWANRRARMGDDLPWSLPLTVATLARLPYEDEKPSRAQLERAATQMAPYVEHLRLRDEDPDAMGTAQLLNAGPHPINSRQTLQIRYTVGTRPLAEGARLTLSRGTNATIEDPAGPGFVTAETNRSDVVLVPTRGAVPYARSFQPAGAPVQFEVSGGTLNPGDTVTIRLGDTSAGGPGFAMGLLSNDFIPLELYVRLERGGPDYVLPRLGLKTQGIEVAGVHGFAPSVLGVGETFDLVVRSEDMQTNRATGPIPGYRVLLNGEPFRELPSGNDAITKIHDIAFDKPGVYRFSIVSMDESIRGEANPILVEQAPQERIFWGETHGHSGMAEGRGTSDGFFRFGRDDANLDFLVHSEHDLWMDDAEWEELRANTQEFYAEGEFIPYLGYEWTTDQNFGGHHNVVFRTAEGRDRVPRQTHPTLALLYQGLREKHAVEDVLIIPHAHQVGDWRNSDPEMQTLVEIQSFHGVFEWFGHMYLRHGHHVGFISASDDHSSHPGYGINRGMRSGLAGVMAPEKSRDAIFHAMKDLRTYAVMGDRMIIRFDINGARMGQRAPLADERNLRGRIISQSPIDTLVVHRNSQEIWRKDLRTLPGPVGKGQDRIEVEFTTDSQPLLEQRDIPRGRRFWSGTITVDGARLIDVDAPAFIDVNEQAAEIDPQQPNRINFRTVTRGQTSSLTLVLEGASADTKITVDVEPSVETAGNNYTRLRRGPIDIPAWKPTFRLSELDQGFASKTQDVKGHKDAVGIRQVAAESPLDYTFDFVDKSSRDGDYYTLRVLQENDQLGWSSPIWVGGVRSR